MSAVYNNHVDEMAKFVMNAIVESETITKEKNKN